MPPETIYQPQVGPGGMASIGNANPDAFGAQTGEAISRFGDAVRRKALVDYKIDREQKARTEAAALDAQQTQQRLDDAKFITDARANWTPGYADQVAARMAAQREALVKQPIVEDATRAQTLEQFDRYAAQVQSSEYEFDAVKQAAQRVQHHSDANDASYLTIRTTRDPQAFPREMAARLAQIHSATGVGDDVKEKLAHEYEQGAFAAHIEGMIDRGQGREALAMLDSGKLPLDQREFGRLRNAAEVEIRRGEAVAAQQVALEKKKLTDDIAVATELNTAGAVQDAKALAALAARARAAGDESGAIKLDLMRKTNSLAQVARAMTPVQRDARIGDLAAIAKPSPDQQIELKYLRDVKGSLDNQFNNDRAGFFTANGQPPPALDGSPQAGGARIQWAQATGAPVLTNNEVATYKERAAKSPAERVAVADELSALGHWGYFAARQTGDEVLARAVLLDPTSRAATISGLAQRKANPQLIDGQAGNDAREMFDARLGTAMSAWSGEDRTAAFEAARNMYADWVAHRSSGAPKELNSDTLNVFIHKALGGIIPSNGGEWRGGIGAWQGRSILLPDGVTQSQFDTVMSRMTWDPKEVRGPVFRDGTPRTPAQIRSLTPVQMPNGMYEFHGPNGVIAARRDGGPFRLDIRKLAESAR